MSLSAASTEPEPAHRRIVTPLSINFGKFKKVVEQTITVKNDGTADLRAPSPALDLGFNHISRCPGASH